MLRSILFVPLLVPMFAIAQDANDRAARVAKLDEKLLKTLSDLASTYDATKNPEATHFFCECAVGFGSTDPKISELKKKWEDEVYYGRSKGGAVLADTRAIDEKVGGLAKDYKAVFDELVKTAGDKQGLSADEKRLLHAVAVKVELTRSASQYVQGTQRFNDLRSRMKLRAVLWDFEASRQFILAGWYMTETGDYVDGGADGAEAQEAHLAYGDWVSMTQERANRIPYLPHNDVQVSFDRLVDKVRTTALVRQNLLNPDVRRIWLGEWKNERAKVLKEIHLYAIPRIDFRKDIATPSARSRETVAEDRDKWVDVEESISLKAGGRTLVSRYPCDGETDAPCTFTAELKWSDPVVERKGPDAYGVPIMLRFFTKATLSELQCDVGRKGGARLPCRQYLTGDKRVELEDLPTVMLLPEQPLDKGATYSVRIKGKLDGTTFDLKWEFTTRDK